MDQIKWNSPARVTGIFAILSIASSLFLCSCVSSPEGGKRFDPWKAAVHADEKVGDWLENRDYPVEHRVKSSQ